MKFMNKKCTEMTMWDSIKYLGVLYAIIFAIGGAIMALMAYWDKITEFFGSVKDKIFPSVEEEESEEGEDY